MMRHLQDGLTLFRENLYNQLTGSAGPSDR